MRCWGYDAGGQLGDGGTGSAQQSPSSPVGGIALPASVADLSLAVTSTAATATVGDTLTLTITAANGGPDAASAAVATGLPAGLTLVTAGAAQGSHAAATGIWHTGAIASGGTATLTLTVRADAAGAPAFVTEITDATAPDPDSVPANDAAGEDDRAGTTITVSAPPAGPPPDQTPVAKVAPDALTLGVGPRRDRSAPFRFRARGELRVSLIPLKDACSGLVTITAKAGTRTVLTQRAPLTLKGGACAYRATAVIRDRKRIGKAKVLTFRAAFAGGERLNARTSKARRVRVR